MSTKAGHRAEERQSGISHECHHGQKDNTDAMSMVLINNDVAGKTDKYSVLGNAMLASLVIQMVQGKGLNRKCYQI